MPTPLNRKMANIPITAQQPAIAMKTALFDAWFSYQNGNLTAINRSIVSSTIFNLDKPSNKTVKAMTTLQETKLVFEPFNSSNNRKGIATVATKKSETAKLKTMKFVLV